MADQPENAYSGTRSQAEQDRIDLNNEVAGIETGRMHRFLTWADGEDNTPEGRRKKEEREQTMLDYLLANDAQYAKAYHDLQQTLEQAQIAVDRARVNLQRQLEVLRLERESVVNRAAKLDNGAAVFLSQHDGKIHREDGSVLSDDEAAKVKIDKDAPNWEEYQQNKQKTDQANQHMQELNKYQHGTLDRINKRMQDTKDPPSLDDVQQMNQELKNGVPKFVTDLDTNKDVALPSLAEDIQGKMPLNAPNLKMHFDEVHASLPDLSETNELPAVQVTKPQTNAL